MKRLINILCHIIIGIFISIVNGDGTFTFTDFISFNGWVSGLFTISFLISILCVLYDPIAELFISIIGTRDRHKKKKEIRQKKHLIKHAKLNKEIKQEKLNINTEKKQEKDV